MRRPASADDEDADDTDDLDDGAAYAKVDIHLRETFRILGDFLNQPAAAGAPRPAGAPTSSLPTVPGGRG